MKSITSSLIMSTMIFVLQYCDCIAASTTVRISQVYGGGGNTGAVYENDFIELFNASSSPVSLSGWSIQYAAAAGSTWHATTLSGVINAGGYYLIELTSAGAVGLTLPTPDATGTTNMSASEGKVALVNNTTTLSNACPSDVSIVDMIGYGSTASCYEGSGAAPRASNTESVIRTSNGCIDTDDNSSDFTRGTPVAHNSSALANLCTTAGVDDPGIHSAINIYSRQSKLYVDFKKINAVNSSIEIYNRLGQLLSSEKAKNNSVYIKEIDVAQAAYVIVKIINGDEVIIKRLAVLSR